MSEASDGPSAGKRALTYASSGVDIDAGNEAVRRIKAMVSSTRRPEQLDDLGGFAGMIGLPAGLREPILVGCTDGVGTKLLVAIAADRHDTVGIDLVAMCVNDLYVTGAQALFLLDYVATSAVAPQHIEAIVSGVVEGCRQAGCALLGGETAELPGMYAPGHYDLAASAVGVVDRTRIWGAARVEVGDAILALPSSGLHSNGYSLARRALLDPEHGGLALSDPLPGGQGERVGDALLVPTRIYERAFAVLRALPEGQVHAAAHITGGGLVENPPRVVRDEHCVELDLSVVPRPAIFAAIAAQGVSEAEMRRTFNCGVGMLLYVAQPHEAAVLEALTRAGETVYRIGQVGMRRSPEDPRVRFLGD